MTNAAEMFTILSEAEKVAGSAPKDDGWMPIMPVPPDAPTECLKHRLGQPSDSWTYLDAEGRLLFAVYRFDKPDGSKEFFPLTYGQRDGASPAWAWKAPLAPRPLYGLDRLAARPAAPVLITEGEKSTDAAQALFPDYVAITSPSGSKAAAKADWSPVEGRQCRIWPDNDSPGTQYAEDVARLTSEAQAADVGIVDVPTEFPKGWDLADAAPEGWTLERLRELLEGAVPWEPPKNTKTETVAKNYTVTERGVFYKDPDPEKDAMLLCGPLNVVAETRDGDSNSWGVLLEWLDHDGRPHTWAMPRSMLTGDAADVRGRLLDGGLYVSPNRRAREFLTAFLMSARTDARVRCVDRCGWSGGVYVMPDQTYGEAKGERVILQSVGAPAEYKVSGSLEEWQRNVAAVAVGNSRLAFAISTAFAGPILHLTGEESGGFHFAGGSSSGKTTVLRCAASVWGGPVNTWRTTDNAAESWAQRANDGLLCLDELSQVDGKAADALAYMLSNQAGKGRSRRDGMAKPIATWRLVFLSTGEIGLAEKMAETGKKTRAGQAVRVIEIPADAGVGHKLFEVLHGFADGDLLARHLRAASEAHKGHAVRIFLERITPATKELAEQLKTAQQQWLAANTPKYADGQVTRAAARFAIVAVAGELAAAMGILPWADGEASNAAAICFNAWLQRRGGTGAAEIEAGLRQVRKFFEQHGAARFTPWDGEDANRPTINRAGFRKTEEDGTHYFVLPETFREEVCRGHDSGMLVRAFVHGGLVAPDSSDGKPQSRHRLPGMGTKRCIHFLPAFLEDAADA